MTDNHNNVFILKNVKSSPNDDALQPQSSLAEYSRFVWGAEKNLSC